MDFIISDLLFLLAVRGVYRKLNYLQFRNILGQILFASFFIYLFFVYRITLFPFPLLMFLGFAGDAGQFTETARFIKQMIESHVWFNFIPFKTIHSDLLHNTFHLAGNLLLLAPLAFYLLMFYPKDKIGKLLFIVFITSVSIETIQFILTCSSSFFTNTYYRGFDIDDIILNTVGGLGLGIIMKPLKLSKAVQEGQDALGK
ncbi:VanZ family protein [Bacillus sp. M6-12]|uniref:VanZ family protein n=1 Tax=Bacillus sp. M6-12 TaxID=2054166 RepID=UPI002155F7D4|nr:VanZ family protein [Bacillus sp. M6-12]